jgi:hypothetical protein
MGSFWNDCSSSSREGLGEGTAEAERGTTSAGGGGRAKLESNLVL